MMLLGMAAALVLAAAAIEWGAWALIRSLGHVPTQEFPRIEPNLIEKFGSFDSELGHVPQPNTETFDKDISGKAYSTRCSYNEDQARTSRFSADAPAAMSTFGDSFCQCRGVEDSQTWQRRLEDLLDRPVRNYGVGGHGLDQAYLRYLRVRQSALGEIVIFAVSACTIERIVGVYKHYIEFGNVLGVKPRFRLSASGRLEMGASPAQSVEELASLRNRRQYIHEWDENRVGYFKRYSASFPYSWFLLRNSSELLQAITRPLCGPARGDTSIGRWAWRIRDRSAERSRMIAYERKNRYFRALFSQHEALFVALCKRISESCRTDGRKAVLLMLPDYTNIRFMKQNGHYYRQLLDRVSNEAMMDVVDSYDLFQGVADPRVVFLKENASGHHTALGNQYVGDCLLEILRLKHHEHH